MANDMINIMSATSISSVISSDKSGPRAAQVLTDISDTSTVPSQTIDGMNKARNVYENSEVGEIKQSSNRYKNIEKQVQDLQEFSKLKGWAVSFSIDDESDKTIIKVVDSDTQKMIRQIPSEELLSISKRIQALKEGDDSVNVLSGLLLDSKI